MFPGPSASLAEAPLDVYIPRTDGQAGATPIALLGIPFGSGIIGVPQGDELALHCHVREDSTHTWADQLHFAATGHLDGDISLLAVPAGLMQHVAAYDPRDGTTILDSSWYAKSLARDWLGSRRRHLSEELYTTAFPEHQRRRVILSCVREGKVPSGVRAFAERNGELALCDPLAARQQAAAADATPKSDDDARVRVLNPEQTRRFLAGLPGSTRNVESVEVRSDGPNHLTHYRLRYGGGMVGSWCFIAEREQQTRRSQMTRISSLRRR